MMRTLFDLEPLADAGLQLNDAQRRAITHDEGPLLVIAGAGTGQTRVIVERIRHLLQSDPHLSGEHILGHTFTDTAAGAKQGRVVRGVAARRSVATHKTCHPARQAVRVDTYPPSRLR